MRAIRRAYAVAIATAATGIFAGLPPALACLWDHDTLQQERGRFPSALELITGKFLRHSKEFYEWRIKDRSQKLAADPNNLAYYDDLAVAYQKTGQTAKAIATMEAKEKLKPGLYETAANLGTFYVLDGNLDEGLKYIDKALAINPHAHFDREQYQKWLVEYAISRRKKAALQFPLGSNDGNFADFLETKLNQTNGLSIEESQKAVKAVLGMMRFANYDNPLLLEVLGDLLKNTEKINLDAKQLATRAYLAASDKFKGKPEQQAFIDIASRSIFMQSPPGGSSDQMDLAEVQTDFAAEKRDAQTWYQALKANEIAWINSGANPDAEFDKLYAKEPETVAKTPPLVSMSGPAVVVTVGVALIIGLSACLMLNMIRRFQSKMAVMADPTDKSQ